MAEQQESSESAKRKSYSDIFLIIGILSILIGFFTFLIPWIWGIPLTIAGIMMRRKEKGRKRTQSSNIESIQITARKEAFI